MSFINVPTNLSRDSDFFECNPELKYFDYAQKIIKKFGRRNCNAYMWAIYLSEDPDSKFYAMDIEDKRKQIANNFLMEPDFDWSRLDEYIHGYVNFTMSKQKRRYYKIDKLLDKMLDDINSDDIDGVLKFFSKLKTTFEGVNAAEEAYKKEKEKSETTRGEQKSGFFAK